MISLIAAALLSTPGSSDTAHTAELPPPTALALEIAEGVGATLKVLHLVADPSVSPDERGALEEALAKTGLFELTADAGAAKLQLRRVDDAILATVTSSTGERLWVGKRLWPTGEAPEPKAIPPSQAAEADEEIFARVAAYRRQRLSIKPIARTFWRTPLVIGYGAHRWHRAGMGMSFGTSVGPLAETTTTDWGIVRGKTQFLDELEFARLVDDSNLEKEISDHRFSSRLWWGGGFGLAALAGIGAGVGINNSVSSSNRDMKTLGTSLIALGAVSGILALMFPRVGTDYIQSEDQAQIRIDRHNAEIRRDLGVSADDLKAVPRED